MFRVKVYLLFLVCLAFGLSGCVVRTYPVTKDRVDQDLIAGNRGCIQGKCAPAEPQERKTTRTTQTVEIELHSPIRFESAPKVAPVETAALAKGQDEEIWGNRGYVTSSETPQILVPPNLTVEKYTVQKNDTLQKISRKFYGTTRKWAKIYAANKAVLKSPNKVYPGQVIDIPIESPPQPPLKETKENLK